jgi:hypothetical protein
VEEHSLAADKDELLAWARGTMQFTQVKGKRPTVRFNLPDEEALDSLAARCRPFILQRDTVYYGKALNALKYFVHDDNETFANHIKDLRADWQKLDLSSKDPLGYLSWIGKINGPLGEGVSARSLAYAWLYGDLVHADNIPDQVGQHGINYRYQAGVLLITNIAVMAVSTLNLVRAAHDADLVPIPDEAFTESVLARGSTELPLAHFVMAPVDTPMAKMEAALDALRADGSSASK